MIEEIKKDKLTIGIVLASIVLFITGIIFTAENVDNTYAVTGEDYECPLGGYPEYSKLDGKDFGYFCQIDTVNVASANYPVGSDLRETGHCKMYLNEMGYTITETTLHINCSYKAVQKYCYYCAWSNTYEWASSPKTSCPGIGWTKKQEIISADNCITPTVYTLTYDTVGGNKIDSTTHTAYDYIVLPIPTKTGYRFIRWVDSYGESYEPGSAYYVVEDEKFTADWMKTYYVKYNTAGGNAIETTEYDSGTKITLPSATSANMIFKHWTDGNGNTYEAGSKYTIYQDTTFTAVWAKNYTIKFNTDGGVPIESITKTEYTHIMLPTPERTAPERTDWEFVHWEAPDGKTYAAGSSYAITGDATLKAIWKQNTSSDPVDPGTTPTKYIVTYDGNGGTYNETNTTWVDNDNKVAVGDSYTTRTNENFFKRAGYTFIGWKDQKGNDWTNNIGKSLKWNYEYNVTLYAQWKPNNVEIKYNVNEGKIATSTNNAGSWSTNAKGDVLLNNKNHTTIINYGENLTSEGLNDFNNSKWLDIKRAGYDAETDKEWICLSDNCKGKKYSQANVYNASDFCDTTNNNCEVILGVNWEIAEYTITYDGNGGLSEGKETWAEPNTISLGESYTLLNNTKVGFVKEGYKFNGWKDQNGKDWSEYIDKTIIWGEEIAYDVILKAQWAKEGENDKTDEELDNPDDIKTGDALIYTVWTIGLGTLAYATYYFITRRKKI